MVPRTRAVAIAFLVAGVMTVPARAQRVGPVPIKAADAPAAVGPYSQAVSMGPFVFLSGQLGLDPANGQLVAGGVENETRRAMVNLGAVLKSAGLSFNDVVKSTVYVTDIAEFSKVNAAYGEFFTSGTMPARATVGVASLPRGAHVEIEAVAMRSQ